MIKVIDIDKLFDKYIEKYVYDNIGKVKPEEIENQMPVLYGEFGNKPCSALDDKTPNEFYREFSTQELLECLTAHLEWGVSVSDFLCEAITAKKDGYRVLIKELDREPFNEEYVAYIMNFLNDMEAKIPAERYLEFCLYDYPESIGELATEFLRNDADGVKEKVLEVFSQADESKKVRLTEILSNCKKSNSVTDDKVFDILVAEFVKNTDNIPLYAGFLSKYGDERALPFLLTAIESEKINYSDFEELRFAIETLGGSYDKKRDFSADKTYKKIKGIKSTNNLH